MGSSRQRSGDTGRLESSENTAQDCCARCDTARVDWLVPLRSCSRPLRIRSRLRCRQGTAVGQARRRCKRRSRLCIRPGPSSPPLPPCGRNNPVREQAACKRPSFQECLNDRKVAYGTSSFPAHSAPVGHGKHACDKASTKYGVLAMQDRRTGISLGTHGPISR